MSVKFYWPWARIGSAIESRATNPDKQDKKCDIKGKQAARKRTKAWAKNGTDTNQSVTKGRLQIFKLTISIMEMSFKSHRFLAKGTARNLAYIPLLFIEITESIIFE